MLKLIAVQATFAGGCFWCMEPPFEGVPGVTEVEAGYANGAEVVRIEFDEARISFASLLEIFWRQIDPTQGDGQFCDKGTKYRSGIFFHDAAQQAAAEASLRKWQASGRFPAKIVTEIAPVRDYARAAEKDQDYYAVNPIRYNFYRWNCGRDRVLDKLWGKDRESGHRAVDPAGAVPQ